MDRRALVLDQRPELLADARLGWQKVTNSTGLLPVGEIAEVAYQPGMRQALVSRNGA